MIFNREILESNHILFYYYLSFEFKMHCMDTLQHFQANVTACYTAFGGNSHKVKFTHM